MGIDSKIDYSKAAELIKNKSDLWRVLTAYGRDKIEHIEKQAEYADEGGWTELGQCVSNEVCYQIRAVEAYCNSCGGVNEKFWAGLEDFTFNQTLCQYTGLIMVDNDAGEHILFYGTEE